MSNFGPDCVRKCPNEILGAQSIRAVLNGQKTSPVHSRDMGAVQKTNGVFASAIHIVRLVALRGAKLAFGEY